MAGDPGFWDVADSPLDVADDTAEIGFELA